MDTKVKLLAALIGLLATSTICHAQTFTNPDFEAGNFGFSSDYEFSDPYNPTEGQFSVRSDPRNWNLAFVDFGDHTSGTGKMLVVNGATSGQPVVWRQTISIAPNTSFQFQAWAGSAVGGGPANLFLKVNGIQIGSSFVLPNATGSWVVWNQAWTSAAGTSYTFEIINANTSSFPNDFYVDDISLLKVAPELAIRKVGGAAELSWPVDPAWGLFTSSSLAAGSWSAVTNSPIVSGARNVLLWPIHSPQAFFRLQSPP